MRFTSVYAGVAQWFRVFGLYPNECLFKSDRQYQCRFRFAYARRWHPSVGLNRRVYADIAQGGSALRGMHPDKQAVGIAATLMTVR